MWRITEPCTPFSVTVLESLDRERMIHSPPGVPITRPPAPAERQPPRPANMFLLWARGRRSPIKDKFATASTAGERRRVMATLVPLAAIDAALDSDWAVRSIQNRHISTILGIQWKQAPAFERARYAQLQKAEAARHRQLYPEYKFTPSRPAPS